MRIRTASDPESSAKTKKKAGEPSIPSLAAIEKRGTCSVRKKEMKLVITFHTTADAMAMEKYCKAQEVAGRLIPVPRAISAGCGLAWCTDLSEREHISEIMGLIPLREEAMHEVMV